MKFFRILKNTKLISFLIISLILTSCTLPHDFSVLCLSYDGKFELLATKNGQLSNLAIGSLGYYKYPNNSNDFKYSNKSGFYKNSYVITNMSQGIQFTLLPDMLHAIVKIWKDKNGHSIKSIQIPLLCFKTY